MEMWDCALQGRPVRPTICRMTDHDRHMACHGCKHNVPDTPIEDTNSTEQVKRRGKAKAKMERES